MTQVRMQPMTKQARVRGLQVADEVGFGLASSGETASYSKGRFVSVAAVADAARNVSYSA
jgi:hypothetical protein